LHGLFQSSGIFCVNDDDSLAFFLCKAGFDVWLGNNRASHKIEHQTLKPSDSKFWAWTVRDYGAFDLPAMVHFVRQQTQKEKVVDL
jgi:predicted alpha/beta hydrolase